MDGERAWLSRSSSRSHIVASLHLAVVESLLPAKRFTVLGVCPCSVPTSLTEDRMTWGIPRVDTTIEERQRNYGSQQLRSVSPNCSLAAGSPFLACC